jgi:hypothetical protein
MCTVKELLPASIMNIPIMFNELLYFKQYTYPVWLTSWVTEWDVFNELPTVTGYG